MNNVVRLKDFSRRPAGVRFEAAELRRLLHFYGRKVADGAWRDYAIDSGPRMAAFQVFRHARGEPEFIIAKFPAGSRRAGDYAVSHGRRLVRQARSVDEALSVLALKLAHR